MRSSCSVELHRQPKCKSSIKTSLGIAQRSMHVRTPASAHYGSKTCEARLAEGLVDEAEPHNDLQQRFRFLKRLHAVAGRGARPPPSLLHGQGCRQGPTIRKRRHKAEGQISACDACARSNFAEPLSVCATQR